MTRPGGLIWIGSVPDRDENAYYGRTYGDSILGWLAFVLKRNGLRSAKGGIVDTAIIAGTLAVKRTHELIPFCHPLPIDGCLLSVDWDGDATLRIDCHVRTVHRTGVEMEALTGATVAALTVYDMCKALSHAIVLGPAKLVGKRGGKRDVGQVR